MFLPRACWLVLTPTFMDCLGSCHGRANRSRKGHLSRCGVPDQTIRLWDTKTWEELSIFREHENEVWAVDFDGDGQRMVSGGKNGDICVWNPNQEVDKWPIAIRNNVPRGWHRLYSQASFSSDGK